MHIKKHIRLVAGIVVLLLGIAFFIVPAIPILGIVGLFAGTFLLAPYIPVLNRFKEWIKKKDSSGRAQQTEQKMNELEKEYGEQGKGQQQENTTDVERMDNERQAQQHEQEKKEH